MFPEDLGLDVDSPQYTVDSLLQLLGARLREARLRRNMTLEDAAERAGTTRKTVAEAEKGNPSMRLGTYVAVFIALGIEDQLAELATKEREYEELQCDSNRKRAQRRKRSSEPKP